MIRPYQTQDLAAIRAWHEASGIDYPLPDLSKPLFALVGVAEHEGQMVAASAIKLVGEQFLWLNPRASRTAQVRAGLELQTAIEANAAAELGLEEITAWLPPHLEQKFGELITRLGWERSRWATYTRFL